MIQSISRLAHETGQYFTVSYLWLLHLLEALSLFEELLYCTGMIDNALPIGWCEDICRRSCSSYSVTFFDGFSPTRGCTGEVVTSTIKSCNRMHFLLSNCLIKHFFTLKSYNGAHFSLLYIFLLDLLPAFLFWFFTAYLYQYGSLAFHTSSGGRISMSSPAYTPAIKRNIFSTICIQNTHFYNQPLHICSVPIQVLSLLYILPPAFCNCFTSLSKIAFLTNENFPDGKSLSLLLSLEISRVLFFESSLYFQAKSSSFLIDSSRQLSCSSDFYHRYPRSISHNDTLPAGNLVLAFLFFILRLAFCISYTLFSIRF